MNQNPYLAGLELVQNHPGTSGRLALAKCILSVYNSDNAFSIGEILAPLDYKYTQVVLAIVKEYSKVGETEELCQAGRYVCKEFPRLLELSKAMRDVRFEIQDEWRQKERKKLLLMYPDG